MESFKLTVPKALYSNTVLLRAAYMFINQAYFHFSAISESWIVEISNKEPNCDIRVLAKEFENALISQSLREIISEKTKSLREIIYARALTSTYIDEEDPFIRIRAEQEDVSQQELAAILQNWFEAYEN